MRDPTSPQSDVASGADISAEPATVDPREIRWIGAFWALFALVTVANHAVSLGTWRARDLAGAGAVALSESALWTVITPLVFREVDRGAATGDRARATTIRVIALSMPVVIVVALVGTYLRLWFDQIPPGVDAGTAVRVGFGFEAFMALVIYGGVTAAALARAYSRRYHARETHAAQLEAQLTSARLDALRRQLDPHFLFNTLNLISSLADTDTRATRRMITRLSELLRFSLEGADVAEVPLRRELALLDRYLDIIHMRFGERLEVVLRTDDAALDVMVPSLILQPLVENAVKHGVEKLRGPARIEIDARCEADVLVLRVQDNGPAWDRTAAEGARGGVGVRNTIARLRQLYGVPGRFTLAAADGGGTVAEVRIPARSPTVLHAQDVTGRDTALADDTRQAREAVRVG